MAGAAEQAPDYGNWVSMRLIYAPGVLGVVFLALGAVWRPFLIGAVLCLGGAAYFAWARRQFSPAGGDIQSKIRGLLFLKLSWDGKGRGLDIGCGNGALAVELARQNPEARIDGIDYWGAQWEYSQGACEQNAVEADVADRTEFRKGTASSLPFENSTFDAVVSNLVFHEVADTRDKRMVVREALRVLKPGGSFAFQDLFMSKSLYGDPDDLLATIKSWGIRDVELYDSSSAPFIPTGLKLPFMVGRIGVVYGMK